MRTTLTIDDDVLSAARALADHEGRSVGEIISKLARKSLVRTEPVRNRHGIPQLPITNPDAVVTMEIVNRLRDEGH